MGCYDYTCAVSALPISAGTPVVALLIQESRWSDREPWVVRSLPVYARYNDYGSIEDYPEDIRVRAWTESLKHDAIEKGVGDNEFHDLGYRPHTATFANLLDAMHSQDRANVCVASDWRLRRSTVSGSSTWTPPAPPKGVPTISAIEEALGDLKSAVLVDSTNTHEFRVRASSYNEDAKPQEDHYALMEACLALLAPEYAVMHSCGSGNYSGDSELVVRPRPGTKDSKGFRVTVYSDREKPKDQTRVQFVLIRRDVWDFLLTEKSYAKSSKWYAQHQAESYAKILAYMFPEPVIEDPDADSTAQEIKELRASLDMDIYSYVRDYPFIGAYAERYKTHETSTEDTEILKKDTLDLLTVLSRVSVYCRVALQPRILVGEQHGDLAIAAKYHAALAKMMRTQKRERGW